jgi:hypothetical protein
MTTKALTLTVLALAAPLLLAQAQTSPAKPTTPAVATPAAAEPSSFEQFMKEAKNPLDWLNWGADLRVRNEYYNNIVTLSDAAPRHEQDVIRFRGRLWGTATIVTNLTLNGRLSAEPREWMKPAFVSQFSGRQGMEWRYGIADNLNVKWNNILDLPLSLTAGRQDILIGDYYDWWLVSDGTPGDGSWTFFLDSIRLNFDAKDIKTKFDMIYIYQNARPSEWMPTIGNSSAYTLTEQNEQGVILYASNKSIKNTQLDGYFIYKRDDKEFSNGDNADIYTTGGKLTGTPADHWQYSVEGAYQFGHKQDGTVTAPTPQTGWRPIDAYGGKAKLTYLFKDPMNNQVGLVGEFLSGDDPNTTGKDEMFDLLWGRWPRWSELYIYSYVNETSRKIAQINNIGRFGPTWSISPTKKLSFSATYNAMFAPQTVPTRNVNASLFSYNGSFRGHYLQTILRYQFNKNIAAHLWGEFVWQGDYYTHQDLSTFVRAEVLFTF